MKNALKHAGKVTAGLLPAAFLAGLGMPTLAALVFLAVLILGDNLLDHQQRGPLRAGDPDDPRPVGRCQLPGAGNRRRGFARFSSAPAAARCTARLPTPQRRAPEWPHCIK